MGNFPHAGAVTVCPDCSFLKAQDGDNTRLKWRPGNGILIARDIVLRDGLALDLPLPVSEDKENHHATIPC